MNHLRAFITVLLILVFGWLGVQVWKNRSDRPDSPLAAIEAMETNGVPQFEAQSVDGKKISTKDLKGQVVILNFWASWCGPCIEEVPSLIKLVEEFKGQIHLLAISGDSNKEDIEIFLKSFPQLRSANIDIIWDKDRSLMEKYGVAQLPESFIAGKDQKLIKKLIGSINWYNDDSKAYMKTLLSR